MRFPVPGPAGPAGPAGPKDGDISDKTFKETQCARRATSSIDSPCLVSTLADSGFFLKLFVSRWREAYSFLDI